MPLTQTTYNKVFILLKRRGDISKIKMFNLYLLRNKSYYMNFNIFLQVFSNLEGLASVDYHAKYEHQTSLKELFVCIL